MPSAPSAILSRSLPVYSTPTMRLAPVYFPVMQIDRVLCLRGLIKNAAMQYSLWFFDNTETEELP